MSVFTKTIGRCILVFFVCFTSCKKFITIDPPVDQVTGGALFNNDAMAMAALTGIYSQMMASPAPFTAGTTTIYTGLSADELQNFFPGSDDEFVSGKISQANHSLLSSSFWQPAYADIYAANACIEGAQQSDHLSTPVKNLVVGEAKFIRAFCYFYLVNLFGDVPLVLQTDYTVNAFLARTDKALIYTQVIKDLQEAADLLPSSYATSTSNMQDRTRPNKWAAKALLARVYLFVDNWSAAEAAASSVINPGVYSLETDPAKVFLKTSSEAIWQLQPVNSSWNTWEGRTFIPASNNANPTYILTASLLDVFDSGDVRKESWVGERDFNGQPVYFPNKYKVYGNGAPLSEYYMVLRLAEQFLIRAEARAHQNNIAGSQEDINTIRGRAGLSNTTATDQASLLLAIEKERQTELFAEWGHRWLDLKRTGRIHDILSASKPGWQANASLWPIPVDQIKVNPSLTQNPGY